MPTPWTLVLKIQSGQAPRNIGGLGLALRLGLDAQRAGANALVLDGPSELLEPELTDPRLTLKRCSSAPAGQPRVEVAADTLLHRQSFSLLELDRRDRESRITLAELPQNSDVPFWFAPIRVLDQASARRAERLLFRALRKREDGWTSRWLNRYVSLAISRLLAQTPLRPNVLSFGILGIGLYGAWLASRGTYPSMLLGAFLFQMQSILDGCDGELSRVTYRGSYLGEWLDTIGDDLTNYSFFAGSSLGLYHQTGSALYLIAGGVVLLSGVVGSGLEYRYLLSIHSGDLLKYPLSQATSNQTGRFGFIAPLFKRDTFVFLTLIAAAFNVLGVALIVFAIGAVGVLFSVLATELRLARERKATKGS